MSQFIAPKQSLGNLDAEAAAKLISAAADVALIVDNEGVILDLAFGSDELSNEGYGEWLGQPWALTVTAESKPKVEALLRDAASDGSPTWRHVNHPSPFGADVPILYSAIKVGRAGRVVAVGRNLRAASVMQQRLVEAQQSLERDYARLRHAETRYRLLFQMASEAILIVDGATQRVVEANPIAVQLLGNSSKQVIARHFPDDFHSANATELHALLNAVRITGHAEDVPVRIGDRGPEFRVTASLFRQDNASHFLIRLSPLQSAGAESAVARARSIVLRALEGSPDGFVVTDPTGRVLFANHAFVDLVQLATEDQVRGNSLDRWFGRPGVDLSVLIANLRQHGAVRLFATSLRGEFGAMSEVEISAVSVDSGPDACMGFTIRGIDRRLAAAPAAAGRELPRSVEQLTELIGRVPLKDIVRETTDVIERLCIEAALELTSDNRASAAEMLGLSRQSLYVKLHRYGLGDLASDAAP